MHSPEFRHAIRVQAADGTPFLLLTRSGNTPPIDDLPDGLSCNDSPGERGNGNLVVFRLGSREKHGERLRSNRLARGRSYDHTAPPQEDKATIHFTFVDGGLVLRNGAGALPLAYHPGGLQAIGSVLAVPLG